MSKSTHKLHIENLENRQLMAGDFVAVAQPIAFVQPARTAEPPAQVEVVRTRHMTNCDMYGCHTEFKDTLQIVGTEQSDTIQVDRVNVVTSSQYNFKTRRFESVYEPRIRVRITNPLGTMTRHIDPARHELAEVEIDAKGGNDTVRQNASYKSTIRGGRGNDRLFGGPQRDEIYGDQNNDYLYGQGGNDHLDGGTDSDRVYGGTGADRIYGKSGNDYLYGQDGNDHLRGGHGHDSVDGGRGNDELHGESGRDSLFGRQGNDVLRGGDDGWTDYLYGHDGNDVLYGGPGADYLYGHAGLDYLYGESGNDRLRGGDDDDLLNGGSGWDSISGEGGRSLIKDGTRTRITLGNDIINSYVAHLNRKEAFRLGDFDKAIRAAFNGPEAKGISVMGHTFNVKPFTVYNSGNTTVIVGRISHDVSIWEDDQFDYTIVFKDGKFEKLDWDIDRGGLAETLRKVQEFQNAIVRYYQPPPNERPVGLQPWDFSILTDTLNLDDRSWEVPAKLILESIAGLAFAG